jgi:NADP-dependent 3-hydroxy acid dehydrogenase YdfG
VVIPGRHTRPLEETAAKFNALNKGTKVLTVKADLTVDGDVKNLFTQVVGTFGRSADIILASAGTNREALRSGEERVDDWWSVSPSSSKIILIAN